MNVVYTNKDGSGTNLTGTADIAFTAYAPATASLSVDHIGSPHVQQNGDGSVSLELYTNPPPNDTTWDGAGITIVATTATADFAGSFMFLQLINVSRFETVNNTPYYSPNYPIPGPGVSQGWNIDATSMEVGPGPTQVFGYGTTPSSQEDGTPAGVFSWSLDAEKADKIINPKDPSAQLLRGMIDIPTLVSNSDATSAAVGDPNAMPEEEFRTFLMYRPNQLMWPGGTWVAMSYVLWGWGESATKNNGQWVQTPNSAITGVPLVMDPATGDTYNPIWTGRVVDIDSRWGAIDDGEIIDPGAPGT